MFWTLNPMIVVQPQVTNSTRNLQQRFTWDSSSPLIIGQVFAGEIIETTTIVFTMQFDSLDWQVKLGLESQQILLLDITEPVNLDLQEYESNPGYAVQAQDNLILQLLPGTATQGGGIVYINLT